MTTETVSTSVNNLESCVLCSTKYNRNQSSLYKCKHCSIPLCLNCTKEHHKELVQDVAQISHQYDELQELLQTKQMMIVDETTKSIEHVNQYFDIYINELRDTQQKIIENMERAKQDAQNYLVKIDSNLRSLVIETKNSTKESVLQMTKMTNLSIELKKIEQQLKTYQVTRIENLIATKPNFSIKFECSTVQIETSHCTDIETNKVLNEFSVAKEYSVNQSAADNSNREHSHLVTSYAVDRMASDGRNILYTSYYNDGPDLIAYCLLNHDDNNADEYQDWRQSRIDDMIWWRSIGKFICATTDGIYTIEYNNNKFKTTCILDGKWSYIRVASNIHELFVWINSVENNFNGIQIYSTQFEHTRTISFNTLQIGSFVDESTSFCVTDNLIASICTRNRNSHEVFQITFCDMDMNKLNSIVLGRCINNIEIRTDGKDRFFITTGLPRCYIVSYDGTKQMINLQKNGDCITVLDDRRIAVNSERNSMEILTY